MHREALEALGELAIRDLRIAEGTEWRNARPSIAHLRTLTFAATCSRVVVRRAVLTVQPQKN
jgi:hypothetical protein